MDVSTGQTEREREGEEERERDERDIPRVSIIMYPHMMAGSLNM